MLFKPSFIDGRRGLQGTAAFWHSGLRVAAACALTHIPKTVWDEAEPRELPEI